jgi:hypothetical protein
VVKRIFFQPAMEARGQSCSSLQNLLPEGGALGDCASWCSATALVARRRQSWSSHRGGGVADEVFFNKRRYLLLWSCQIMLMLLPSPLASLVAWRGARRRRCSAAIEEVGVSLSSSMLGACLPPRLYAGMAANLQPLVRRPCFDPVAAARSFQATK